MRSILIVCVLAFILVLENVLTFTNVHHLGHWMPEIASRGSAPATTTHRTRPLRSRGLEKRPEQRSAGRQQRENFHPEKTPMPGARQNEAGPDPVRIHPQCCRKTAQSPIQEKMQVARPRPSYGCLHARKQEGEKSSESYRVAGFHMRQVMVIMRGMCSLGPL